jgi:hypothetical protein
MSFTLSNCIERINQVLNYPSLTYTDVSAFFDQAIAELNTSLHIGLRSITECMALNKNSNVSNLPNVIVFTNEIDASNLIPVFTSDPTYNAAYYYNSTKKLYGIRQTDGTYSMFNEIYAIYNTLTTAGIRVYKAIAYGTETIAWAAHTEADPLGLNLADFLPNDWIVLFLIPYVCFKYSVRDGDTGALYSEEFVQGFQQLQQAYNVPSTVYLPSVAHLPAYTEDVKQLAQDLNTYVTTRAITENMRTPAIVKAVYSDFYDKNGWGY